MSKHVRDKISLYMDGELSGAELGVFEAHIKTCKECAGVLAATRRAVKEAKDVHKEQPLPVNFYAKLNHKLDDLEIKKDARVWGAFMRGAAAVFTLLIVGVLVYNMQKQTKNFSGAMTDTEAQMPKEEKAVSVMAEKPAPAPAAMAKKKVMTRSAPDGYKMAEISAAGKAAAGKDDVKLSPDVDKALEQSKQQMDLEYEKQVTTMSNEIKAKKPSLSKSIAAPAAKAEMAYDTSAADEAGDGLAEEANAPVPQEPAVTESMMAAGRSVTGDEIAAVEAVVNLDVNSESDARFYFTDERQRLETEDPAIPQVIRAVFTDEKAWQSFAASLGIKDVININWAKQMIVAIIYANDKATEYPMNISVIKQTNRILVRFEKCHYSNDCQNVSSRWYPYAIKVIEKSDLPVVFITPK